MFLIGDSHTRSYGASKYLSPVFFLTSGKRINLSGFVPFVRLLFYCFAAAQSARKNKDTYAIVIGEPDCRRLKYGGWAIHEGPKTATSPRDLRRVGKRFKLLMMLLQVFAAHPALIIGIGTPNSRLKKDADDLNEAFKKVAEKKNILFFNPMLGLSGLEPSQSDRYIGFSVFNPSERDEVHLSGIVAKDLDAFLETTGLKKESRKNPSLYFKSARYISEFGVYKL